MSKQRRWTQEDINAIDTHHVYNPKKGRYGANKRCVHADGTKFDSKREMARYGELLLLQKAGVIEQLEVHPRFLIIIGGVQILMKSARYPNGRKLQYVADFQYRDLERKKHVIEDVKMESGHRIEVYKIKRALMDAMGRTITEV